MPLSKNDIKFIRSLQQKKYRDIHQKYIVEGTKLASELLSSTSIDHIDHIYHTADCTFDLPTTLPTTQVSFSELERISHFKSPNQLLIVVRMEKDASISYESDALTVVLDDVKDPGNLGTIIRTAEWFGVQQIICSEESVDCYNPKVIQSSMGAFFRMRCVYTNLEECLSQFQTNDFAIYGAEMEGKNLYSTSMQKKSVLLMGSESHGISNQLKPFIQSITIPKFGASESLNVAMATGIILSHYQSKFIADQ